MMAEHFNWSWEQTRSTPTPVIHEFLWRLQKSAEWENRKHRREQERAKSKHGHR